MNGLSLQNLVLKEKDLSQRFAWVEFKGLKFKIRYISRATLQALAETCMIAGYDPKARGRIRQLNTDKFVDELATTIVHDWQGCTPKTLSAVMPLDLDSVPEEKREEPIEFTRDNLLLVIRNVHDLDGFLQEVAVDASLFKHPLDEELSKNSQTSQTGA